MRRKVRQAGAAVPVRMMLDRVDTDWQTILEAPDFSVPDPQRRFPDARDPDDAERRIQPGFALIEAPLMFHNKSPETVTLEVRILTETGAEVGQAVVSIIQRDTFMHPAPGQRLLKTDPNSTAGDQLQVRASEADAIQVTSIASEGSAEQHEPGAS